MERKIKRSRAAGTTFILAMSIIAMFSACLATDAHYILSLHARGGVQIACLRPVRGYIYDLYVPSALICTSC